MTIETASHKETSFSQENEAKNLHDDAWRGLDPDEFTALRALGHRMLDDMFDRLETVRERKVWQPMPPAARAEFQSPPPRAGIGAEAAYAAFQATVLPYELGNTNPRFMGWVHGGGTAPGMLAELLAGALSNNLGGRDHAAVELERQVIRWSAAMLGLPPQSGGGLVTGTSLANLIAVLTARTHRLGAEVRQRGICGARLTAYTSTATHSCVPRAFDMAGFGWDSLRLIPVDADHRMDLTALSAAIAADRAAGCTPFLVVGTAGTVDTGAIDKLPELAALCAAESLWFHIDAAFGALLALSPTRATRLAGIEHADSVAFDFHKWAQVPYDAGCILVRDQARLIAAFAQNAAYLRREARGLAGGAPWLCDLGPDLSRGFRALKVWMTLVSHGTDALGQIVDHACEVATHLATRIAAEPRLELLAPVSLNIVCFRYVPDHKIPQAKLDRLNADIVADVQEAGLAAPSTTMIGGNLAIRCALFNHRTRAADADALVDAVLHAARVRENV